MQSSGPTHHCSEKSRSGKSFSYRGPYPQCYAKFYANTQSFHYHPLGRKVLRNSLKVRGTELAECKNTGPLFLKTGGFVQNNLWGGEEMHCCCCHFFFFFFFFFVFFFFFFFFFCCFCSANGPGGFEIQVWN